MTRKFATYLLGFLLPATSVAQAVTVQLPAQGVLFPGVQATTGPAPYTGIGNIANLNSATAQFAVTGYVFEKGAGFQTGTPKTIQNIKWATGNRICAGCTSVITYTIESTATSGPPAKPSGTVLAAGGATITQTLLSVTSAGMNNTGNFTTGPVVHYGDLISFRAAFSSYDSGSVGMAGSSTLYDCNSSLQTSLSTDSGATWGVSCLNPPNIEIDFTDGSVGTILGIFPYNAFAGPTTDTFASGSNPNEIGLTLNFPFGVQVDQLCAGVGIASTSSTWTIRLTDNAGTPNVLASVSPDPHTTRATGTGFGQAMSCFPIAPVTLAANTDYRVGVLATGAGNVTITDILVSTAGALDASFNSGQGFAYTTRHGAAWAAPTATKRPYMGVMVSAFDIGNGPVAGGGGMMLLGVGH